MDILPAQILGVFLAETAKNVAKGSANALYQNSRFLFYNEITALNLNELSETDGVIKKLEDNPQIIDEINRKLNAFPEMAQKIIDSVEQLSKEDGSRNITANTYIERPENLSIHNSGTQIGQQINYGFTNNESKTSLKLDITFRQDYIYGSLDKNYYWQIDLLNDGETTVKDFRIDIKFPNTFLNQFTIYGAEIVERRTEDYRLFRTTNKSHNNPTLYPDDKYLVFSGNYFINENHKLNNDLDREIFISVFSGDNLICKVQRKMSEMIDF